MGKCREVTNKAGMCFRMSLIRFVDIDPTPDLKDGSDGRQMKKQTQSNPLRVSRVDSERYAILNKNKPIEVKCLFPNELR